MFGPRPGIQDLSKIIFDKTDVDHSGSIDTHEFQTLCRNQGYTLSDSEVALVVRELDADNSGGIEYGEFKKWWSDKNRWSRLKLEEKDLALRKHAAETFAKYDTTNKGAISTKDFDAFYKNLVDHKLTTKSKEDCLRDLDSNGDHLVEFGEYVDWLTRIGTIHVKVMDEKGWGLEKLKPK